MIIDRKHSRSLSIPLQWLILLAFVVQIFGAVGLVSYLSYRSGKESANKLANRLKAEISTRVTEKTTTYLQAIDQVNKNNISDLRRSLWSFDDFSSQEKQAWQQMQLNSLSPITIIGFGTPTGGHRAVELLNDGTFSIRAAPNGGGNYKTFTTNPDGSLDKVTETSVNFDSRQRPWFKVAVQSKKATWTNIYPHIYTGELLVALAEPVYDLKNENFLGVTYGIRSLEEISRFLRAIDIKTGTVFIMERDQTLVATSSLIQKPYQLFQNAKDQKLLKAIDSQNLQISGAAKYLRDRNGNLANIRQAEQFEFEINGDRQSVQVTPISDRNGLNWAIVVVIPESEFMADMQANKVWTILLYGITLLVATGISIITTRWITKPILRISRAIASGDWQEPLAENSMISEISTLAMSFNQMTKQVQQSFDRVEVALKESQEQYKVLFQTAPIGISITDKNGYIVESNIIAESWLGKPQLLLQECQDSEPNPNVIRPDGSPMPIEEYACIRALRSNTPVYDVETGIICADGILRWFSVSAAPIPSEQHGVVLIHVDISDRKQSEEALRTSEARFRTIALSLPGVIYVTVQRPDGSTYFEYISSGVEDLNELTVEQALQNPRLIYQQTLPEDLGSLNQAINYSFETMTPFHYEWRIITPSGKLKWIQVNSRPEQNGNTNNYEHRENGDIARCGIVLDITARKQAEIALDQTIDELNYHIENSPLATIRWDREFRVIAWSKQAEEIFGWSAEEALGKYLYEWRFVFEDDLENVVRDTAKMLDGVSSVICQNRNYHKNGSIIYCEWYNSTLVDESGNLISMLSLAHDISDRKQVEIALKSSEKSLSNLISNLPGYVYRVLNNHEYTPIFVSQGVINITGYRQDEYLIERSISCGQEIHVDDVDRVWQIVQNAVNAHQVFECEYRIITKSGQQKWVWERGLGIYDDNGNLLSLEGFVTDISDRKQVEIALKQSEQTNRAILSSIPDLLLRVRRDGSCLDFIPPLTDQAGTFLPLTKHLSEVLPPDLLKLQLQRIDQALATGDLQVWEHQIIKNDQICHEEIRVFPCGIDECLVIVRDISARKQIELALIEAKAAAEAATKAKSEFLASMSHEIRTPMNGVIGMTQILEMTELTTNQQEFVKTIKDSGQALLAIINDILDFSKIESGMLEIEARDFDLEELVRGVCNLLENQAIAKQINLKYAIAPNIPKNVIGDHARLRQILLNLVGNALKFTQNGHVSISVSGEGLEGKYEITFAIADTGIGIQSHCIDLLFQAFTQADNSISREYGGTGLGLAISKRLVNLMDGTIWVESLGQVGGSPPINWKPQLGNPLTAQGSTFYFTIALLINQASDQTQTVLAKKNVVDGKFAEKFPLRILLVEDNRVNQMVAKLMLKRLGYQINAIANNGLEAVQAVQNHEYDLILMDVQMPKMDGLTATKMIRTELKSNVRIVAMTADAMPKDRQVCLDVGMDDFISKPISIQALMSIVSSTK